jgi:hypothetical protein
LTLYVSKYNATRYYIYKYFVGHSALMVQSLLENEKKPDVYELGVAEGIKEMLALRGFTKEKILNSTVSNLAETLQIDYYVALIIYSSAKKI